VELEQAFEDRAKVKLADIRRQHIRRFFLNCRARIRAYFRNRENRESLPDGPRLTGLLQHLINYPECPFILQYNIAIAMEELRRGSGPKEFQEFQLYDGVTWDDDPLASLRKIASLRDSHASWSGKFSRYVTLLREREKLELSLYAQSAMAHIMSLRPDGAKSVDAIRKLLKDMGDTSCAAREQARCFDLRIDRWRAIETTKAVALASLARALAAEKGLAASQEARNRLYESIASEPHLVDAYLQLADLYIRWREEFATNWAERAKSLLGFAHEINPACGGTSVL
jgi:hypothetical protein